MLRPSNWRGDTLGPFPEDVFGMRFIIPIVDNFSKFVGLYPAKNTLTLEFVKAFLSWVGIFGVLRIDGRSQFFNGGKTQISVKVSTPHHSPLSTSGELFVG